MSIILFSLSFLSLLNIFFSYIVIPFQIYTEKYILNNEEQSTYDITRLINEWHSINLVSQLKMGNPNQEVTLQINPRNNCFELNKLSIDIDKLSYFFSNDEKPIDFPLFILNNSKTFNNVSDKYPNIFNNRDYFMGNDEIYLYNNLDSKKPDSLIKTNNLYFRVAKNNWEKVNCMTDKCGMHLGIQMFSKEENECPNFNKVLKNSDLIKKYIFSIHYYSQNSGSLIFGGYPHEYMPNKYKEEQLTSFYTTPDSIEITDFNIFPDYIYSINSNNEESVVSNNTKVIFELYYGFFIGAYSYQEYIEKNFFNELIEKNICYKNENVPYGEHFFIYYDMFSCNEENLKDIKKFPKLKFYIKNTNTSFIFDFDDLFLKIGNKYYFMVVFERYKNSYWILGYPFFKKYDIVFDEDSKTISYYANNYLVEEEKNSSMSQVVKIVLIIILSLIVLCGLLVIGFYIGRKKYLQRKKRANELNDDDYDYKSNENIINNNEGN